jgi:hypothetical protein
MSRVPLPEVPNRIPDAESEHRLSELRRVARETGAVTAPGILPDGAPFPRATAETGYYGIPLLKQPQWTIEVPIYFFVGGAAGAAAAVATAADWLTDDDELVRSARWVAAVGGLLSPALLTMDLGRPERFLNMLRVFKLQSPMNVGAWTLTAFSSFAAASAFANLMRRKADIGPVRLIENAAGMLASATGLVMASYTGVLIGATTIPVWNNNAGTLPAHFAASGLNCAVSILELLGHENSRALNLLGLAASGYETFEGFKIESERTRVNEPLRKGASGWIVRSGGILSGPLPVALRLAYAMTGNKSYRKAAAYSSILGSLLTRFGWIRAGHASAKDHRVPLQLPEDTPEVRASSHELAGRGD